MFLIFWKMNTIFWNVCLITYQTIQNFVSKSLKTIKNQNDDYFLKVSFTSRRNSLALDIKLGILNKSIEPVCQKIRWLMSYQFVKSEHSHEIHNWKIWIIQIVFQSLLTTKRSEENFFIIFIIENSYPKIWRTDEKTVDKNLSMNQY